MKQAYGSIYLITLLISVHFFSFKPQNNYSAAEALRDVTQQFQQHLNELEEAIAIYNQKAIEFADDQLDINDLQQAHINTRLSYKKVEFLLEYIDRQSVKKSLNGPPLYSLEPKVPEVRILEPVGLQVLDETVFGENPQEAKNEIRELTEKLQKQYKHIKKYQYTYPLQHKHIFESARYELNRIFSLGLTGFDTPGTLNAIPEAITSIQAIQQSTETYLPLLPAEKKSLASSITTLFDDAINYLKQNNDFDSFNRLHFLKTYINPLYAELLEVHNTLAIEKTYQSDNRPTALNYEADNIFAEDFLNAQFYANLNDDQNFEKRVALGRLLFFDPILSSTNTRSCASCHHPDKAFTDGMDKSLSLDGTGKIQRNAPTVINAVFAEHYFYDLREPQLERQIKHVVLDEKEFNTDFLAIIDKLAKSEDYKKLFAEAYSNHPNYQLSKWSISDALACYVSELRAFNSPFDQYVRGETNTIDPSVERGFNLFMGKASCGTCHFAPTFSGLVPPLYVESESEVLGVPATNTTQNPEVDPDLGRIASGKPGDEAIFYAHSFKTVTVRNIALTAPYMHNGVYNTLEEVIDFYNKGGGAGMGMDLPYQTLPDAPLNLNTQEIEDLISFMNVLTDTTSLTTVPIDLPEFENQPEWNTRQVGGEGY
jgi:cytochrome c peroxidase